MADTAVATEAPAPATPAKKQARQAGGAGAAAKKPKAKPTHPKTSEMVNNAIKEMKERSGSSLQAIKKYIAAQYKVDAEKLAPFIRKYLKSAVESGALIQTKGKGASGSFKLESKSAASKKPAGAVGKAAGKAPAAAAKAKKATASAAGAKTKKAAAAAAAAAASPSKAKSSAASAAKDKKAAAAKKKPAPKKAAAPAKAKAPKAKKTAKPPTKKPKAPKPKKAASTPKKPAAKKASAAKKKRCVRACAFASYASIVLGKMRGAEHPLDVSRQPPPKIIEIKAAATRCLARVPCALNRSALRAHTKKPFSGLTILS
ncbi:hypothetical protein PYW07_013209 [Mythimna separata]|uniref:H15 domain-containing protein n=2 Tax=Mythimna separata TaxID=271217 RepID=A0AAD7Y6A8_MYTSE|nr:hypothetical protein PYW07_013198 [Mythimna separata]KAJ8703910.1 hypothetical protein PYW07_013204 [Mythimna separata]KAJ8703915.1 hypothetical protein PYW07_013209 [Mythimna separata]